MEVNEVGDLGDAVGDEVFGEVVAALFAEVADAEGVDEAVEGDGFGFFDGAEEVFGAAVFEEFEGENDFLGEAEDVGGIGDDAFVEELGDDFFT